PRDRLAPLDLAMLSTHVEPYHQAEAIDLRAYLLMAVVILLLADALVVFWLSGGLSRLQWRRAAGAVFLFAALFAFGGDRAFAQAGGLSPADQFALRATLQTRLAYVVSGNSEVDSISRAGLEGLSLFLAQRTALEPGDPMAVDP